MKRKAWRIVRDKRSATAFDGEGAARVGGRWNLPGTPVVYTSEHRSLAALETLIHLNPLIPFSYVIFEVSFDENWVETVPPPRKSWRTYPPGSVTQSIGSRWVKENRSAILRVPSVVIPEEFNLLLNPRPPDFRKIVISAPAPFRFDPRLF